MWQYTKRELDYHLALLLNDMKHFVLLGVSWESDGKLSTPKEGLKEGFPYFYWIWLVGCFGFSGPLRQYFSLYQAVSQREGERGEKGQRRVKMPKQHPLAPSASAKSPYPTIIQIVGRPGTGSLPRTIAPPDHSHFYWRKYGDTKPLRYFVI